MSRRCGKLCRQSLNTIYPFESLSMSGIYTDSCFYSTTLIIQKHAAHLKLSQLVASIVSQKTCTYERTLRGNIPSPRGIALS